jgi:hypothetical protein
LGKGEELGCGKEKKRWATRLKKKERKVGGF